MIVEPIRWQEGRLTIIDQTLLPGELRYIKLDTVADVWHAIKRLSVRGAPAIGCTAAYGVLVGLRERAPESVDEAYAALAEICDYLDASRPTAVNLGWALRSMRAAADASRGGVDSIADLEQALESEADRIFEENFELCRAIGDHGADVIPDGAGVLTHCNTGPLATGGEGTALSCVIRAHAAGKQLRVYADETRPLLQGARLTAWEMQQAGIPVTLICDNTAAVVLREGKINVAIVGADRIAANGDAANKIGTYGAAVLCHHHGVPFYVAAPYTTFDLSIASGADIPIEYRDPDEVTCGFGPRTAPADIDVYTPAFDVTPAELITGIITEYGILYPPFTESIREAAERREREAGGTAAVPG
ncbi:MAG: S-methyl-5-thioribose-1-phosphate isomerase [Candidatus Hydrogenedens sp.]|nr:S-methyl-5-thioribose-1-phosphate isomerase [Candidatus Hydrogenedens sp.]